MQCNAKPARVRLVVEIDPALAADLEAERDAAPYPTTTSAVVRGRLERGRPAQSDEDAA